MHGIKYNFCLGSGDEKKKMLAMLQRLEEDHKDDGGGSDDSDGMSYRVIGRRIHCLAKCQLIVGSLLSYSKVLVCPLPILQIVG